MEQSSLPQPPPPPVLDCSADLAGVFFCRRFCRRRLAGAVALGDSSPVALINLALLTLQLETLVQQGDDRRADEAPGAAALPPRC